MPARHSGKVDKGWGYELIWATNELYCGKIMVFSKKGNVLIDDRQSNIDAWESEGGIGILHKNARDTIKELKMLRSGISIVKPEVSNA